LDKSQAIGQSVAGYDDALWILEENYEISHDDSTSAVIMGLN
jgi:hypothetical protein